MSKKDSESVFAGLSEPDKMQFVLEVLQARVEGHEPVLTTFTGKDAVIGCSPLQLWQTIMDLSQSAKHRAAFEKVRQPLRDFLHAHRDEIHLVAYLASYEESDRRMTDLLGLDKNRVGMVRIQAHFLGLLADRRVYISDGVETLTHLSQRVFRGPLKDRLDKLRAREARAHPHWRVPALVVPIDTTGCRGGPLQDWDAGVAGWGELVAAELDELLGSWTRVGVTGGRTLRACVNAFQQRAARSFEATGARPLVTVRPLVAKRHVARTDPVPGAAFRRDELAHTADALAVDLCRALNNPVRFNEAVQHTTATQLQVCDLFPFVPPGAFGPDPHPSDAAAAAYRASLDGFEPWDWALDGTGARRPPLDAVLTSIEPPFAFAPAHRPGTYAGVPLAWAQANLAGCIGNWPLLQEKGDRKTHGRIRRRYIGACDEHFRGWVADAAGAKPAPPGVIALAFRNSRDPAAATADNGRARACLAAMRAGLVSTLILDASLAEKLLHDVEALLGAAGGTKK